MSSEQALEPTIARLQAIDGYDFEDFVADFFEADGWEAIVTQDSQDGGIDVIVEKYSPFEERAVIQAKRQAPDNKVGRPDVQQYSALIREDHHRDMAVIVTTSAFTRGAYDYGREYNVKLMDGAAIAGFLIAKDRSDLLDDYAPHIDELEETPEEIFPVQETSREEYYEEKPLEFAADVFTHNSLFNALDVIHQNRVGRALVESLDNLRLAIEENEEHPPIGVLRSTPRLLDQNWFDVDITEELSGLINDNADLSSPPPERASVLCIRQDGSVTVSTLLPPADSVTRQHLAYMEDCVDFITANYEYDLTQVSGLIVGKDINCRQTPHSKLSRLRSAGFEVRSYGALLERSISSNRQLLHAVRPYFEASEDREIVEKLERLNRIQR